MNKKGKDDFCYDKPGYSIQGGIVMELAFPLTIDQIEAANRLHDRLKQWKASDRALASRAEKYPDFDENACLIKAVAINALYGTNVFAIVRMARHIETIMAKTDLRTAGPELVKTIAAIDPVPGQKKNRRHHSFASKFAHFFVDSNRFPIMDSYAIKVIKRHLGRGKYRENDNSPYVAYIAHLNMLMSSVGYKVTSRNLDHYLWITGQYLEWRKKRKKAIINAELKNCLKTRSNRKPPLSKSCYLPNEVYKGESSDA